MFVKDWVTWARVRHSLWFTPSLMTIGAIALALLTIRIDIALDTDRMVDPAFVFSGGAEGARGVLSAIAGGMITVTGVIFSVTVVALQLASNQFSPRILRNFMADTANQIVLGVFIGTFTYTLLVLRSVRSTTADAGAFVPSLSVTMAIFFVLLSVGFLIFFIHHTATSIQASTIVDRVTNDALHRIARLFPDPIGQPAHEARPVVLPPATPSGVVTTEKAGYVQVVDEDALFALAEKGHMTIRMEPRVGEFVLEGAALASVWPASVLDDDIAQLVRRAFVLGPMRSMEQDPEFGIIQLVDIAVKALSPGINDPTTANICIDRLAEVLVVMGNRAIPEAERTDAEGRLLFIARPTTFERMVDLGFDQIRHFGATNPMILAHLLRTLGRVVRLVPEERRPPLLRQAEQTLTRARFVFDDPTSVVEVEEAATWLQELRQQRLTTGAEPAA